MDIPRPAWRAALVAALVATSLLAPIANAQSKTATPGAAELRLTLEEDGTAGAEVVQVWTGPAARSFRQSLDVYFGASDGILTDDELQNIANATQADMVDSPLPWLSTFGEPWSVMSALVTFEGASGRVSATGDVTMRHELSLASGQPGIPQELDLDAPWNATLHVGLPPGKAIAGGGAPPTVSRDERASLRVVDATSPEAAAPAPITPANVTAGPDAAVAEPVPNASAELDAGAPGGPGAADRTSGPNKVVIAIVVGLALILAALAVGAYYALARKGGPWWRKRSGA